MLVSQVMSAYFRTSLVLVVNRGSKATYYGDDNFSVLKEIVAYNCTSSATSIVFGSS